MDRKHETSPDSIGPEQLLADAVRGIAIDDERALRDIARTVKPLPQTLSRAWLEWHEIDERISRVGAIYPNVPVYKIYRERAAILADMILFELEALTFEDVKHRIAMLALAARRSRDGLDPVTVGRAAKILTADIDNLQTDAVARAREQATQQDYSTATERRASVITHLCDPETSDWSDRGIARACGVSPQTVSNWRRKLTGQGEEADEKETVRRFQRSGRTHRMVTAKIGKRL